MTRLESAHLEALQSFGGHGLHDVLRSSKKVVSLTLQAKAKKVKEEQKKEEEKKEEEEEGEKENVPAAEEGAAMSTD